MDYSDGKSKRTELVLRNSEVKSIGARALRVVSMLLMCITFCDGSTWDRTGTGANGIVLFSREKGVVVERQIVVGKRNFREKFFLWGEVRSETKNRERINFVGDGAQYGLQELAFVKIS